MLWFSAFLCVLCLMLLLVPMMTRFVKDVSGEERVTFFLVDSGRYRSGQRGIMRRWEGLCRAIIRDSPRSVGPVSDDGDRHRADSKTVKIYDVGGWMTDEAEIARYFLAFSSTSKYFSVAAPKQKKKTDLFAQERRLCLILSARSQGSIFRMACSSQKCHAPSPASLVPGAETDETAGFRQDRAA